MAVSFSIAYRGGLRCDAEHGPSKTHLITDAPTDNHGRGESFSPTDLIATGLATCMLTTMAIIHGKDGIVLDGASASVEKHMTTTPPRSIARLVVRIAMPRGIPAAARNKVEQSAHGCPVARSLGAGVVQDVTFSYPD
ncbi:MAG TPA: OsmC family protein [Planctomycetota bacterium]|nr:OsmC family protein [Planctomycetota bacterium]